MVLVIGVEPIRCFHRGILSPLRLPIPPYQQKNYCVSIVVRCDGNTFGNTVCKQNALLHILLRSSHSVNNKIATRAKFERNYKTTHFICSSANFFCAQIVQLKSKRKRLLTSRLFSDSATRAKYVRNYKNNPLCWAIELIPFVCK